MRSHRSAALAVSAALAATTCAWAADKPAALPVADPVAVLGEPYIAGGVIYTPADSAFDDVGYAGLDDAAGPSISVSHRTLPVPSYVEVTALDSGRTILARVERRGPMTGNQLISLSAAGFAQLGADSAQPLAVRVRRVNPQEYERALLRTNQRAPERLMTPGSLLEVLRKLLLRKSAPALASADGLDPVSVPSAIVPPRKPTPVKPRAVKAVAAEANAAKPVTAKPNAAKPIAAKPIAAEAVGAGSIAGKAVGAKPSTTDPVGGAPVVTRPGVAVPDPARPITAKPLTEKLPSLKARSTTSSKPSAAAFAIQVASFLSRANADATAKKLDGKVSQSGKLWRVHLGPFSDRASADAGLARSKNAGFGDARIITPGK